MGYTSRLRPVYYSLRCFRVSYAKIQIVGSRVLKDVVYGNVDTCEMLAFPMEIWWMAGDFN